MISKYQIENYSGRKCRRDIMCGRYYVDDDTAREIEKVVREVDKKL